MLADKSRYKPKLRMQRTPKNKKFLKICYRGVAIALDNTTFSFAKRDPRQII